MFTPSIELVSQDARGEIYAIKLPDDQELLLLHSKKGTLRGGHSHDVDEIVVVLSGGMKYHKLGEPSGIPVNSWLFGAGYSFNPAGMIHMGEFKEDTWLIEYKLNTKQGKWRNDEYAPWRQQVQANAAGE